MTVQTVLGTSAKAYGLLPHHIHVEATAATEDPTFPGLLYPVDDPLVRLDPAKTGDMTPPTVGDIRFMRGEDDNNIPHDLIGGKNTTPASQYKILQDEFPRTDHGYFENQDYSKAWIVGHLAPAEDGDARPVGGTSNIDIIADATDKVSGPLTVGIRSIAFSAKGQFAGKQIPTVTPFNFANIFVWDPNRPPGTQDHDALLITDLTRVVYQHDRHSWSNAEPSVGPVRYFHILTNTDGILNKNGEPNTVVDFADRNRYWRSKVTQGAAWNDIGSTEAVSNAKGAFPDDYYTITVTAKDAAGLSTTKTVPVLLDNWQQRVVVEQTAPGKGLAKGYEFLPNTEVPIHALEPGKLLPDGSKITAVGKKLLGKAKSNDDGYFEFPVDLTDPDIGSVVADYGADDVYVGRLDARGPVQINIGLRASASAGESLPAEVEEPADLSEGPSQGFLPPEGGPGGRFFAPPDNEPTVKRGGTVQVDGQPDVVFRHSAPVPAEPAGITLLPAVARPGSDPGDGLWLDSLGPGR
ncbi:MAG: hypothetical protein K2X87_12385 [Gemmataceae bacterium]|nr:hypothetical protein [Gemmataceae bacterium]